MWVVTPREARSLYILLIYSSPLPLKWVQNKSPESTKKGSNQREFDLYNVNKEKIAINKNRIILAQNTTETINMFTKL